MPLVTCPVCLGKFTSAGARRVSCPTCGVRLGRSSDGPPASAAPARPTHWPVEDDRSARRTKSRDNVRLLLFGLLGGGVLALAGMLGMCVVGMFYASQAEERQAREAARAPRAVASRPLAMPDFPAVSPPAATVDVAPAAEAVPEMAPPFAPESQAGPVAPVAPVAPGGPFGPAAPGGPPPFAPAPPGGPPPFGPPGSPPPSSAPAPVPGQRSDRGMPNRPFPQTVPQSPPGMVPPGATPFPNGMPPGGVQPPFGAAAVTLANARRGGTGPGAGAGAIEVDYEYANGQVLGPLDVLMVRSGGNTSEVRLMGLPQNKGTIRVRSVVGRGRTSGPVELWMERKGAPGPRGGGGTVISNVLTVN